MPFPSPGDLPDPGIKRTSPASAGRFFTFRASREALQALLEPNLKQAGGRVLGRRQEGGGGGGLVAQSCLTLCDSMDRSRPGSYVHRILQARILEWVATHPSRDLSYPGIEPASPALAGGFFTTEPPGKPQEGGNSF